MVTSVPAWFGAKSRTRKPAGLDITSITDGSGSMGRYVDFITAPALYESLETALRAEQIGVNPSTENKYSFCAANSVNPERFIFPGSKRWATGDEILAGGLNFPSLAGAGEQVAQAYNYIVTNDRDYNLLNERIAIAGSDEQSGQGNEKFVSNPEYPTRYVGIHKADIRVEIVNRPREDPAGFVYTTDEQGTAIYIDRGTISYLPIKTAQISISPFGGTKQVNIDQCRITNGAIYDIRRFNSDADYALLGESLGSVLGKYLYSIS